MIERNNVVDKLRLNLPGNAADLLAEKIRSHIISGEIPAGYIFPNETVFCEQLGVSRSTLREAYKALESTGFIKGYGAVKIKSFLSKGHNNMLSCYLSEHKTFFNFHELTTHF